MYRAGTSLRSPAAISVCSRLKGLGSGAAPRSAHASSQKYPKRDELGRALRSDTMRLSRPLPPRKKRKKAASASDSGAAMAGGSAADGSAAGSSAADGSAPGGSAAGGLIACGAAGGLSFRVGGATTTSSGALSTWNCGFWARGESSELGASGALAAAGSGSSMGSSTGGSRRGECERGVGLKREVLVTGMIS